MLTAIIDGDDTIAQEAVNAAAVRLREARLSLIPAGVVYSIAVTAPVKTEYQIGEKLDTTGLSVTATYSDGTSKAVTGYQITGFDSASAGKKTVTVSYTEGGITKAADFAVTVIADPGTSEDPGSGSTDPGASENPGTSSADLGTSSTGPVTSGIESSASSGTHNENGAQTSDAMRLPIIIIGLLVAASAGIAVVLGKKRRLG